MLCWKFRKLFTKALEETLSGSFGHFRAISWSNLVQQWSLLAVELHTLWELLDQTQDQGAHPEVVRHRHVLEGPYTAV